MLENYIRKIDIIEQDFLELIDKLILAYKTSYEIHENPTKDYKKNIRIILENFNDLATKVDNDVIVILARFTPEGKILRKLIAYLKMTNEFVKLADGIDKYSTKMEYFLQMKNFLTDFIDIFLKLHKSIIISLELIRELMEKGTQNENDDYTEIHKKIAIQEAKNDEIYRVLENNLILRVAENGENITEHIDLIKIMRKLERACDHTANISKILVFAENGGKLKRFKESIHD